MTYEELQNQEKSWKEEIFRESLKVNEECKQALCNIERKVKESKRIEEIDHER